MTQSPTAIRVSDAALLSLLKQAGKISAADATVLQKQKRLTKQSIQELAIRQGFITERGIAKLHASTARYAQHKRRTAGQPKPLTAHLSGPRMLTDMLERAIAAGASAVHIEPRDGAHAVRLRVDGVLHDAGQLAGRTLTVLMAQIKARAGLTIDGHHFAQQGRFTVEVNGQPYVAQVAVLPVESAETTDEKVTIQLAATAFAPQPLAALGYWGAAQAQLQQALARPRGLVLVSGPHASGLSTTFLNAVGQLNQPNIAIATLEDTVAQRLEGVSQTAATRNVLLTPVDAVRAILHHDPDVLGIDQLRDPASIDYVLRHAAAGRLVVGTITGNSASHVLARLSEFAIEPYLLATTVGLIANQRLARKLCDDCKQPHRLGAAELRTIMQSFDVRRGGQLAGLYRLEKIAKQELLDDASRRSARLYMASPDGCPACHNTGYTGFIGFNEALAVTPTMQKLVLGRAAPEVIEQHAVREGMVPLKTDALIKVLLGITSVDEALRVL